MNSIRLNYLLIAVCSLVIGSGSTWIIMQGLQRSRQHEGMTKANMHVLQLTVEDFGVQSAGRYPTNLDTDKSPGGFTVIDLLPRSARLTNSFTANLTEPRLGPAPAKAPPGSVWYEPICDSTGAVASYLIYGFGTSGRLDLVLHSGE